MQADRRLDRMAHAMGLSAGADVAQAIVDMNARLGMPKGLGEMGVERAWFDRVVSGAMVDHCHKTNPRLASVDDYLMLLEQSM